MLTLGLSIDSDGDFNLVDYFMLSTDSYILIYFLFFPFIKKVPPFRVLGFNTGEIADFLDYFKYVTIFEESSSFPEVILSFVDSCWLIVRYSHDEPQSCLT